MKTLAVIAVVTRFIAEVCINAFFIGFFSWLLVGVVEALLGRKKVIPFYIGFAEPAPDIAVNKPV